MRPLNPSSQKFHNFPPKLTQNQRQKQLILDPIFKTTVIDSLNGRNNKVLAAVTHAYFRLTGQFFKTATQLDINFIANQLEIETIIKWEEYRKDSLRRHRKLILEFEGFSAFDQNNLSADVLDELERDALMGHPKEDAFRHMISNLRVAKIELPDYATLTTIIDKHYEKLEQELASKCFELLDVSLRKKLDDILVDKSVAGINLTTLKQFRQETKKKKIDENIAAFTTLNNIFIDLKPVLKNLDLRESRIRYYTKLVIRSQLSQVKKWRPQRKYLHLMAFVAYQFLQLQDVFADTIKAVIKTTYNGADRAAKEAYYKARHTQKKNTESLISSSSDLSKAIDDLEKILEDKSLPDEEKIQLALAIIKPTKKKKVNLDESIQLAEDDLNPLSGEALFYRFLEESSPQTFNKLAPVLECLRINDSSPDKAILQAIIHFQESGGKITGSACVGFLSTTEKRYVDTKDGFKSKLYSVILCHHLADSLKGGGISLEYSFIYRALEDYLINKHDFETNLRTFLEKAKMLSFENCSTVLEDLDKLLHTQYLQTNDHVIKQQNSFVKVKSPGVVTLSYQRNSSEDITAAIVDNISLFKTVGNIPLMEALNTVNKASQFIEAFQPLNTSYQKARPDNKSFLAAIMGTGCHFTPYQFVKLSPGINESELMTTINNYVNTENARLASDRILRYIEEKLPIAAQYLSDGNAVITSSDGQKYVVDKSSLIANYSFKYGGKDPVVSPYTFIDNRNFFFHSEVISGSEREAHYMIDGVLRNDVVKSSMHCTDTHGYTEMVFGASHLLGISFAPRIKGVCKQNIYSLRGKKTYSHRDFPILPKQKINTVIIREQWLDILRIMVSIKLGYTSASQIFRRLNSYSSRNNPIYNALKEFGKIIKSSFILRYLDEPELRASITRQLNKSESGNKMDRALAIGKAEYLHVTKEEQDTMESCKRILKNVMVCWNYLYLTKKLTST